jgi:hypothetical protein
MKRMTVYAEDLLPGDITEHHAECLTVLGVWPDGTRVRVLRTNATTMTTAVYPDDAALIVWRQT